MPRRRLAISAFLALAIAGACNPAGSQHLQSPAGSSSSALTAEQAALGPAGPTLGGQRADDLLVWLASRPDVPQKGDAKIDAFLVGLDGHPIDNASVVFDTDMTNMSHGKYLVATEPVGNGHYAGQVHFLMPGPWRIIAIIERPGSETVNLRFEFDVSAQ